MTTSTSTSSRTVLTVLVAIVAILWWQVQKEGTSPASADTPLEVQNETIRTADCFSETYQEARQKFRDAAKAAGAEQHVIPIYTSSSNEEEYTTDIAVLVGNRPGLVLHTSGVHGVEGYAGSAIQIAWLRHMAKTVTAFPTIVMVHAVNPHGMAHYRRTNENNVDLNRNALMTAKEWTIALERDPNLAHYQDLSPLFNPTDVGNGDWSFWSKAIPTIAQHGLVKLKTALVTGQYHEPKGISYGGTELQPSWQKLHDFLRPRIMEWTTTTTTTTLPNSITDTTCCTAVYVDVHTGLGQSGIDSILSLGIDDTTVSGTTDLSKLFAGSTVAGVDANADEANRGYDLTIGTSGSFFMGLFDGNEGTNDTGMADADSISSDAENDDTTTDEQHGDDYKMDLLAVTQEFGTIPSTFVGKSLVLENAIQHHDRSQLSFGMELMKQAFYVRKQSWRKSVLSRGLKVLSQAIGHVVE